MAKPAEYVNLDFNDEWKEQYAKAYFCTLGNEIKIKESQNIKYQNMPSSLYKYRPVNEYSLDNIKNDTIHLVNLDELNDPYDSSLSVSFDKIMESIFRENFDEIINKDGMNNFLDLDDIN